MRKLEVQKSGSPAGHANVFRRAWNHLTDWEKSPMLNRIEKRRMRKAERLIGEQKWNAVMAMRRGAVPALIKSFGNLGPARSMDIVWAFVGIGTPAVRGLAGALKDENENIRAFSAKALVEIAKKKPKYKWGEFVPAFMEAVGEETAKGAKRNLAELLGEIGDARAAPALLLALKDDDSSVMVCAGMALTKMGGRAVDALNAALGNEDPKIRAHLARAIARMKSDEKADGLGPTMPALIRLLKDGEHEVLTAAADALRYLGDSSAIAPLYELMTGEDSFFLYLPPGEFTELLKNGDTKAGEIVRAREIMASAVLALSDIAKRHPDYNWEPMLPGFVKLVKSNDAWLQQIASGALGTIAAGHPEYDWGSIAPDVARALCVDRGRVGTLAGDALVRMGMVSVKPLISVMNNLHAVGPARSALMKLAKKHPEEVAAEVIAAVNGKLGDELQAISTGNDIAVRGLSDVMLECGKGMENAEA